MDNTILRTPRLRVRYQTEADIEPLTNLWSDPLATRYLGGPREREFLRTELAKTAASPRAELWDLWPAEFSSTGELAGYGGLIPKLVRGKEFLELTYMIVPDFWGKGLATELAQGLMNFGWKVRKLEELIAIIEPENEGSKRVASKAGFRLWTTEERGGRIKEIWHTARGVAPSWDGLV